MLYLMPEGPYEWYYSTVFLVLEIFQHFQNASEAKSILYLRLVAPPGDVIGLNLFTLFCVYVCLEVDSLTAKKCVLGTVCCYTWWLGIILNDRVSVDFTYGEQLSTVVFLLTTRRSKLDLVGKPVIQVLYNVYTLDL